MTYRHRLSIKSPNGRIRDTPNTFKGVRLPHWKGFAQKCIFGSMIYCFDINTPWKCISGYFRAFRPQPHLEIQVWLILGCCISPIRHVTSNFFKCHAMGLYTHSGIYRPGDNKSLRQLILSPSGLENS